jgi:hypothetical protein
LGFSSALAALVAGVGAVAEVEERAFRMDLGEVIEVVDGRR